MIKSLNIIQFAPQNDQVKKKRKKKNQKKKHWVTVIYGLHLHCIWTPFLPGLGLSERHEGLRLWLAHLSLSPRDAPYRQTRKAFIFGSF